MINISIFGFVVFGFVVFGLCKISSIPPFPEGRLGGAATSLPVSELSSWIGPEVKTGEAGGVQALLYCGGLDNNNRKN